MRYYILAKYGVPGRIRTDGPLLRRQPLYPLSYRDAIGVFHNYIQINKYDDWRIFSQIYPYKAKRFVSSQHAYCCDILLVVSSSRGS